MTATAGSSSIATRAGIDPSRPNVFIHTNHRQMVGALVGEYAMKRNSTDPDSFDVHLIRHEDYPWFADYEGKPYLRDGASRVWHNDDLQSFTPLRFMPPELMGYQGRAVITDPDVFAVGDVTELLNRNMEGNKIMCRPRSGAKGFEGILATSVMLLDCAKLTHWRCQEQFDQLFERTLDYADWIGLKNEDRSTIGLFENEWNDFDRLSEKTKLIHNTKRRTQPWKTGLPVDFTIRDRMIGGVLPTRWIYTADALLHAQQSLDAALLIESKHARALQLMGVCCFKLDDDEGAVRYLDLAVAADGQNVLLLNRTNP